MQEQKYIALKKTDWYIIICLVLIPFFIKAVCSFIPTKDVCFQIKHYNKNIEIIDNVEPSKTAKTLVIQGKLGDLTIEFDKEKGVRVASSTCPCQVCVNSGWSKNETLICVPNAVLIQPVTGYEAPSNKFDAISR